MKQFMNITHDYDPQNMNTTEEPEVTFFIQPEEVYYPDPFETTTNTSITPISYTYQEQIQQESSEINVKFVQTHPDATLPRKNHPDPETGDAGFDLFAVETTTIPAKGSAVVPVGMKLGYITPGYWFRIEARSGNGFKKSLAPHFGVIDCNYRGDLGVKLYNFSDVDQVIEKGTGAAQFIVYRMVNTRVAWIEERDVDKTVRGEKGFGSSDK